MVFAAGTPLYADSFAAPKVMVVCSPSGAALARIEPGHPKTSTSEASNAMCLIMLYDPPTEQYRFYKHFVLLNPILPSTAVLPDDGSYLVTTDNAFDNDHTLVLYDSDGRLKKSWDIKDLFSEKEIGKLKMFSTLILWHGSIVIMHKNQDRVWISPPDDNGSPLILDVRNGTVEPVVPGSNGK